MPAHATAALLSDSSNRGRVPLRGPGLVTSQLVLSKTITYAMKLSQAVLGAFLVGLTVQTTSCVKKGDPTPKEESKTGSKTPKVPDNCPACGMG
ncbi:hypothetical protein GCM10027346_08060 [Hymenobacter seoulensis]